MTPRPIEDLVTEIRRRSSGDGDLDRLAAAVAVSEELSQRADAVVGHFVEAARQGGCSWAQIGGVLGVTRQAAQQQDSVRRKRPSWGRSRRPVRPFERCTDRMRRVLVLTHEEAERLDHNWVGTEHLLLGLLAEGEGVAARALHDAGVTAAEARARVEAVIGTGPPVAGPPECDSRPFTPRAKRALELAHKEGVTLGHDYMGTEHALLGLLAEGNGVAAEVLVAIGVDLHDLRRRVLDLVAG